MLQHRIRPFVIDPVAKAALIEAMNQNLRAGGDFVGFLRAWEKALQQQQELAALDYYVQRLVETAPSADELSMHLIQLLQLDGWDQTAPESKTVPGDAGGPTAPVESSADTQMLLGLQPDASGGVTNPLGMQQLDTGSIVGQETGLAMLGGTGRDASEPPGPDTPQEGPDALAYATGAP